MDFYTVLGIVVFALIAAAVTLGIRAIVLRIRNLIFLVPWHLFRNLDQEMPPRSLSSYEPALIPRIRKDFPDFSAAQAKAKVRSYIREHFSGKKGLKIHNVVISQYENDGLEKSILFQAAVSWEEDGTQQKRFDICYSYLLPEGTATAAANCPNCGAAIGFGQVECAYCGSRVVNPLGQHWTFTGIRES